MNYALAELVKANAIVVQNFQDPEMRSRRPVTFLEYKKQGEIMVPSHNRLRVSRKRPDTDIHYKVRSLRALGTGGPIHNHTGVKGDSAVFTPSFSPLDDKFNMSLKQSDNSMFSLQEELVHELTNVYKNFDAGLETLAVNHAFTNRSGVNVATTEGSFNATNDSFEITSSTNIDRAIQITKSVMDTNNYGGPYLILCDTIAFNRFEFQANQGQGNSENLSFQFGNATFVKSIELDALFVALGYIRGSWIAVEPGTISALDWIDPINRRGQETSVNRYSTVIHPSTGIPLGVHEYETRADDSANNGDVQDVVTQTQISVDVSLNKAPLTTATESTLQAFSLIV